MTLQKKMESNRRNRNVCISRVMDRFLQDNDLIDGSKEVNRSKGLRIIK